MQIALHGKHGKPGSGKALRDYQREAVDSVIAWWSRGHGAHPLVVAPTGSGKSLMIAALCRDAIAIDPDVRIVILAHRKELVGQNADELQTEAPDLPVGVYSAGLGRREIGQPITFAGVQSIARRAKDIGPVDIVIIDEAHMIPRRSATRYGQFLSAVEEINPLAKRVGFTATPYRLDSGRLDEGEDAIFDGICYDIGVQMLVDRGFLAPVVSKGGVRNIDLTGVRRRAGEFVSSDMSRAALDITAEIVEETVRLGQGRQGWMVFAASVEHAERMLDLIRAEGVRAELVTGATPRGERDAIIAQFKARSIRCLVNVDVLTTGFNAPHVDLVVLARATESAALYVQIVGRGMRVAPGKTDCLLLDYGGNVLRHGPIDAVRQKDRGEGDGQAPAKQCPSCDGLLHAGLRVCPYCGHEFPPPDVERGLGGAYDGAVLSAQRRPRDLKVRRVTQSRHEKPGKPPSVRVEYWCGLEVHREWVCPEHQGYARHKYVRWCRQLGIEPADTVEEHIEQGAPDVGAITVMDGEKYAQIVARTVRQPAA